ncbi:alpha-tocopherol transfer protein-like [Bacillus rossius redtenbacheri]|uniref:alpha-tocopherol transfer protein-like n=1 Tax=Bacillus rossius redtenbacheri TaxID=93214 RepID=UPI002FDDB634
MALLPPSPKTQKKLKEALYQDPDTTARDVQHIKDWLAKQPHLPPVNDDVWLERFLYGCKYRLAKCKAVLDMYYTVRGAVPELYSNRDPLDSDVVQMSKTVFVSPVPRLTPAGRRLTFLGLLDADPARWDLQAQARRSLMLADLHLQLESCLGVEYVCDLQGVSLAHVARSPPALVRRFLLCFQDAFPVRIKGLHFINAPVFVDAILSVFKPFLKEKIRNRIHIHSSLESLYDLFPRDMLPNEYGGQAGSVREMNDWWQNKMVEMRDWFLSEQDKKADEQKRLGKIANGENLFGLDGSFKTLAID